MENREPSALLDEAILLHRAGELARARALYGRILEQEPANADALHLLGVLAHQAGDPGRGAGLIQRAIERAPNVAIYRANLGEALRADEKAEAAIREYAVALRLDPPDAPLPRAASGRRCCPSGGSRKRSRACARRWRWTLASPRPT